MNWSQEKTVEFIEEYRKREVLWDIRLQEYKSIRAKKDALQELDEKFNCNGVEIVKKKIKNLRTSFHREHKLLTKKISGSSSSKRRKWFGYDMLLFLLDIDNPRPGYSSQSEPEQWAFVNVKEETGRDSPDDILGASSTIFVEVSNASPEAEDKTSIEAGNELLKKRKGQCLKRRYVDDERAEEAYQISEDSKKKDEFSIYGEYVSCEIRKLAPKAQAVAKHKISNILFEAAMGNFDSGDFSPPFGSDAKQSS